MSPRLLTFICLFASLTARAQVAGESPWLPRGQTPHPTSAKIILETDRTSYLLGENVLVHFVVENTGPEPFTIAAGGDYRGAPRHLRFQVTAVDEKGVAAEDPFPPPYYFFGGGIGADLQLKPGEKKTLSVPILSYAAIDHPGVYTIRISHDLGWVKPYPSAETTLTFRAPSAAEAETVLVETVALADHPKTRGSLGDKDPDFADFSCLRLPVFLESIRRRVEAGDQRFLPPLAEMQSPESTVALIRLCESRSLGIAVAAAEKLRWRLPPVPGTRANPSVDRLVKRAWSPDLAPEVRSVGRGLLSHSEPSAAAAGAVLLGNCGTLEDASALLEALSRALDPLVNPRRERTDNILDDPSPVREIAGALHALRPLGFTQSESFSGDGQLFMYFDGLSGVPGPRPARWMELLDVFGHSNRYPISLVALRSIPDPIPAACRDFIGKSLEDPDLGVARVACELAGKSGDPSFIPALLDVISTESQEWLLRSASEAAWNLHARYDLLERWVERLPDEHLYPLALDALQKVIEVPQESYSGRTDLSRSERLTLRAAWRDLLTQHTEEIRTGKRFPPTDPTVTPALFGRARVFTLANGERWPKE